MDDQPAAPDEGLDDENLDDAAGGVTTNSIVPLPPLPPFPPLPG